MAQQYQTTLQQMVGYVRQIKPSADANVIIATLNQQVRAALDRKPNWAGLIKRAILDIPSPYATGSVTTVNGDQTVTGASTAWPTNDVVNTTLSTAISRAGIVEATPASMSGITTDSILYIDSAGTPEIVVVREVRSTTFIADFAYTHSAGVTATQSSYVGRQFRISDSYPIYTIRAVTAATSLELDVAWAGDAVSASSYQIVKLYYTIDTAIKDIMDARDTTHGNKIDVHVSQGYLNTIDPQRSSTGNPLMLADLRPNENGNMLYELYPRPTSSGKVECNYSQQWPEMRANGDRPPYFVNPDMFIKATLAQLLRTRLTRDDPFYDPVAANNYGKEAMMLLESAMESDEGKLQQMVTYDNSRIGGHSMEWQQSHDYSPIYDGGGRWW